MTESVTRVAILGGGMASLACALRLTDPTQPRRFDVTVYQIGWRLGGKGASGRNPHRADRIEEHGLHVWMGFYHEAFTLIREVYAERVQRGLRAPDQPLARWDQAFEPHALIVVAEQLRARWGFWRFPFPRNHERPGGAGSRPWPRARSYGRMARAMLARGARGLARELAPGALGRTLARWRHRGRALIRGASPGGLGSLAELLDGDDRLRRWLIFLDFVRVNLRGLLRDVVGAGLSLDELDELDYRQWLARHGASRLLLESAGLRGMYDMSFAYEDGDLERPNFAAGVFLRFFCRMFLGYKGAVFWKMQAGMGDVVFAPLYQVLRARGVRFEFFHRVDQLCDGVDEQGSAIIDRVLLTRQAEPAGEHYEPLVDVRGLPCWPSEPRWDQLRDAEARRRDGSLESAGTAGAGQAVVLRRGRDFDEVVVGISVGALPRILGSMLPRTPRLARMCHHVETTATQAAQLWLDRPAHALGWSGEPGIVDAYGGAMNTWADLTHLEARESWPSGCVGHIAYWCGPYRPEPYARPQAPSPAELRRDQQRVSEEFAALARRGLADLWPRATTDDGALRWDWLVAPDDVEGERRLAHQYVRANTEPTERYVLSARGATRFRLRPHETGYRNLMFAGDWTRTPLNYGCIEGAVMSGVEAAAMMRFRPVRYEARASALREVAEPFEPCEPFEPFEQEAS